MAGGVGSRFWPLSRTGNPKQFHDLLGVGRSLLQMAYDRLLPLFPPERLFVVTTQDYVARVLEQLPDLPPSQVLAEPVGRNTGPCIAYGTSHIAALDPDAQLLVAAADHLITNEALFHADLRRALALVAHQPVFVTLGITPTRPDTGYGYIQYVEPAAETGNVFKVKTFTEKPSLEIAQSFLESGEFLWNSGMFIFSANTLQAALHQFQPDLYALFQEYAATIGTPSQEPTLAQVYSQCRSISIDVGVMEKADNVYVIRSTFGWSDLGTWRSLYEQLTKDATGSLHVGQVQAYGSANNLVYTQGERMVILKGIQNTIVISVDDVTLVLDRDQEQFVREIVNDLRLAGKSSFL
ncbi:MAG: mannose-1-phosphate guanylyltransferase [Bacteroidia bacterium]|nr:mannose-1-phosphate guanylyltransferase [Bacteroidia bacterium]